MYIYTHTRQNRCARLSPPCTRCYASPPNRRRTAAKPGPRLLQPGTILPVCLCVCVYVCMCLWVGTYTYTHTCMQNRICVHTPTHTNTHAHRAGGHGNVLRTPIVQRPERQEGVSVSVETMLSKLEHIVTNLDAINQRITGVHAHMHACMHAYTYRHQHACMHTQSVAGFVGGVVGVWGGFL